MGADRIYRSRILVVDDEPANIRILERLLSAAGYTAVRSTLDPQAVLGLYADFRPDLVLLDLLMPGIDGYELLSTLTRLEPEAVRPPLLVLTADVTRQAKKRALSMGAMDFLTKPFDHVEALLRIGNLLETRLLQQDLRNQNQVLEEAVRSRTRELRESLDRLRITTEQRQMLISRLVQAQEEERRRIAADIHDDTIQTMVAVALRLEMLRRHLPDGEIRAETERLAGTVKEALGRLRNLLFELRPTALDNEGLEAALRLQLAQLEAETGTKFRIEGTLVAQPSPESRVILFRIAQEALANVRKHANASVVVVSLAEENGGVRLRVTDNGNGFDPGAQSRPLPGHLGLAAMRERAETAGGTIRIESRPGRVTTVDVWLPTQSEPQGPTPAVSAGTRAETRKRSPVR